MQVGQSQVFLAGRSTNVVKRFHSIRMVPPLRGGGTHRAERVLKETAKAEKNNDFTEIQSGKSLNMSIIFLFLLQTVLLPDLSVQMTTP